MWNFFKRRAEPQHPIHGNGENWHFSSALLSNTGCRRAVNEDAGRFVRNEKGLLGVVADGMGGHQAGELASLTAVDVACRAYQAGNGSPGRCLSNALIAANRAVHELASGDEQLADMGTTCTALALCGGFAYLAHVGDSRVYLIRKGDIYQMTEDHTLVMELVRKGMITAKEAREHPERNVLQRALGRHASVEVSGWLEGTPLRYGDLYLLCSDGLCGVLSDDTIRKAALASDPTTVCAELIELTLSAGAPDNVTVGIVRVNSMEHAA
jgi:PPM family protein phosphatase